MATHRWIAQVPSAWAAASFDTNSLPASNDTVIFGSWGQGDVISSLSQTAVDLDLLQIQDSYFGRIGNHGNPLIISADLVIARGRGTLHYQDGNGTTDVMILDSDNLVNAAYIGGNTITRLRVMKGRVKLVTGIGTIADLEVSYRSNIDGDAYVDAGDLGALVVTDLRMDGGTLKVFGATIQNFTISAGLLDAYTLSTSGSTATYQTGGRVRWTDVPPVGLSVAWPTAEYHLMGGTLDISGGGPKTVTTLYQYAGGTLYDPNNNLDATSTIVRMAP